MSTELQARKDVNAILIWTVGMFCIMCWEWLLCLPKETSRIWRLKFTNTSYLYILNRYFGLLQFAVTIRLLSTPSSSSLCHHLFRWQTVGAMISTLITQAILALHTTRRYQHVRSVLSVLGVFIAADFAIMASLQANLRVVPPQFAERVWPCIATGSHRWVIASYFMHVTFYALNSLLFICKPVGSSSPSANYFKHPIRSGLISVVAVTLMNLVNALLLTLAGPALQWANAPATVIFGIVMSCKLVLDEPGRIDEDKRRYGVLGKDRGRGMTMTTFLEPYRESMISTLSN